MESNASNLQLIQFAAQHNLPLNGVFSRDEIPRRLTNGGYIINMDDAMGVGTHWICLYIEGRRAAYFDSFGVEPPLEIIAALKPYKYVWNRKVIQNPASGYCGLYCLVFIFIMHSMRNNRPKLDERLKAFQDMWSGDVEHNLRVLRYFIDVVPGKR